MNKAVLIILFCFFFSPFVYTLELQSMNTGFIGGITLFDKDGPFTGINNPALLVEYGRIKTDARLFMENDEPDLNEMNGLEETLPDPMDIAYSPKAFEINYHLGRLYLLDSYMGMGVTKDFLDAYPHVIALLKGELSNVNENSVVPLPFNMLIQYSQIVDMLKFFSFNLIDLSPLFGNTHSTLTDLTNNAPYLFDYDQIGANLMYNINWLSFYRNCFGICVYSSFEGYAGLLGSDRSLFFLMNDPVIHFSIQNGAAFSLGNKEIDLPYIDKINLGYTLRSYYILKGDATNFPEYLELSSEITDYIARYSVSSNFFDTSPFWKGNLVKEGWGTSLDIGMTKSIGDDFMFAAKLSDILAPIYWTSTSQFDWVLPDLSMGLKYTIPLPDFVKFIVNEPSFFFQMDDLFYTHPVSFFSKLHLGIESKFLFDILEIGGGLNQGYPTIGASLHITFSWLENIPMFRTISYFAFPITYAHLKMNVTYYGKEQGRYPGELGFYMLNAGGELYWGF